MKHSARFAGLTPKDLAAACCHESGSKGTGGNFDNSSPIASSSITNLRDSSGDHSPSASGCDIRVGNLLPQIPLSSWLAISERKEWKSSYEPTSTPSTSLSVSRDSNT